MILKYFFTLFLVSSTSANLSITVESMLEDMRIIRTCNTTYPVDAHILNRSLYNKRFEVDVDTTFKCFLHCLYQNYKLMDENGGFNTTNMRKVFEVTTLSPDSIVYVMSICTEIEQSNKCERAYLFQECIWREGSKPERES